MNKLSSDKRANILMLLVEGSSDQTPWQYRLWAKLQEITEEMRRRSHQTIPEQGDWLRNSACLDLCERQNARQ